MRRNSESSPLLTGASSSPPLSSERAALPQCSTVADSDTPTVLVNRIVVGSVVQNAAAAVVWASAIALVAAGFGPSALPGFQIAVVLAEVAVLLATSTAYVVSVEASRCCGRDDYVGICERTVQGCTVALCVGAVAAIVCGTGLCIVGVVDTGFGDEILQTAFASLPVFVAAPAVVAEYCTFSYVWPVVGGIAGYGAMLGWLAFVNPAAHPTWTPMAFVAAHVVTGVICVQFQRTCGVRVRDVLRDNFFSRAACAWIWPRMLPALLLGMPLAAQFAAMGMILAAARHDTATSAAVLLAVLTCRSISLLLTHAVLEAGLASINIYIGDADLLGARQVATRTAGVAIAQIACGATVLVVCFGFIPSLSGPGVAETLQKPQFALLLAAVLVADWLYASLSTGVVAVQLEGMAKRAAACALAIASIPVVLVALHPADADVAVVLTSVATSILAASACLWLDVIRHVDIDAHVAMLCDDVERAAPLARGGHSAAAVAGVTPPSSLRRRRDDDDDTVDATVMVTIAPPPPAPAAMATTSSSQRGGDVDFPLLQWLSPAIHEAVSSLAPPSKNAAHAALMQCIEYALHRPHGSDTSTVPPLRSQPLEYATLAAHAALRPRDSAWAHDSFPFAGLSESQAAVVRSVCASWGSDGDEAEAKWCTAAATRGGAANAVVFRQPCCTKAAAEELSILRRRTLGEFKPVAIKDLQLFTVHMDCVVSLTVTAVLPTADATRVLALQCAAAEGATCTVWLLCSPVGCAFAAGCAPAMAGRQLTIAHPFTAIDPVTNKRVVVVEQPDHVLFSAVEVVAETAATDADGLVKLEELFEAQRFIDAAALAHALLSQSRAAAACTAAAVRHAVGGVAALQAAAWARSIDHRDDAAEDAYTAAMAAAETEGLFFDAADSSAACVLAQHTFPVGAEDDAQKDVLSGLRAVDGSATVAGIAAALARTYGQLQEPAAAMAYASLAWALGSDAEECTLIWATAAAARGGRWSELALRLPLDGIAAVDVEDTAAAAAEEEPSLAVLASQVNLLCAHTHPALVRGGDGALRVAGTAPADENDDNDDGDEGGLSIGAIAFVEPFFATSGAAVSSNMESGWTRAPGRVYDEAVSEAAWAGWLRNTLPWASKPEATAEPDRELPCRLLLPLLPGPGSPAGVPADASLCAWFETVSATALPLHPMLAPSGAKTSRHAGVAWAPIAACRPCATIGNTAIVTVAGALVGIVVAAAGIPRGCPLTRTHPEADDLAVLTDAMHLAVDGDGRRVYGDNDIRRWERAKEFLDKAVQAKRDGREDGEAAAAKAASAVRLIEDPPFRALATQAVAVEIASWEISAGPLCELIEAIATDNDDDAPPAVVSVSLDAVLWLAVAATGSGPFKMSKSQKAQAKRAIARYVPSVADDPTLLRALAEYASRADAIETAAGDADRRDIGHTV